MSIDEVWGCGRLDLYKTSVWKEESRPCQLSSLSSCDIIPVLPGRKAPLEDVLTRSGGGGGGGHRLVPHSPGADPGVQVLR